MYFILALGLIAFTAGLLASYYYPDERYVEWWRVWHPGSGAPGGIALAGAMGIIYSVVVLLLK